MPEVKFYDQIPSGSSYKEIISRKTIIVNPSGLTDNLENGIHILYSPNSTAKQYLDEPSNSVPYGVPQDEIPGRHSVILGGSSHKLNASSHSVILGGSGNWIETDEYSTADYNSTVGGYRNLLGHASNSFVIGGNDNSIFSDSHGVGILNSSNVLAEQFSFNNTVIQVSSGYIHGRNNLSLMGHNVSINGNSNFTVGANISVAAENTTTFSDGRRSYSPALSNALYVRYTNGMIFPDYINIKADNINSPLYGKLGGTYERNRNKNYVDDYGGSIYYDGFGQSIDDITGINLSVGYKALPINIGERGIGPIFCDWSGIISGIVYRSPSNAINIGFDNNFNADDIVIGDHNIRALSKIRSLDKQSDPFSRRAMIFGAHNTISGTDMIVHGALNKIYSNSNGLTIGNSNLAYGTNYRDTQLADENGNVTGAGPAVKIWPDDGGTGGRDPVTADDINDLIILGSYNAEYIGAASTIIGTNNNSITKESRVIGYFNFLSGGRGNVIGHSNRNQGDLCNIAGTNNVVIGSIANVVGYKNFLDTPLDYDGGSEDNSVYGNRNFLIAKECSVFGTDNSIRIQNYSGLPVRNSIVIGNKNSHSSSQGAIVGFGNKDWSDTYPDGNYNSYIFGDTNQTSRVESSTVLGIGHKVGNIKNTAILGTRNWIYGSQGYSNRPTPAGVRASEFANYNLMTGENTIALGFGALAEGSNKIVFGSYTKGLPKAGGNTLFGANIFNLGSYQRMFLNWKGYNCAAGANTIELTLDGILPTGTVTTSNYNRGRAFMPPGRIWNGFVNVIARKGLSSTDSLWSQLRHVTIYRDQSASLPIVLSDTVISTQSGNFVPSSPSEYSINFSGLNDYVVVTARGNGTAGALLTGTAINWHVIADFAETNTYYESGKGAVLNKQNDSQPEGFTAEMIYAV